MIDIENEVFTKIARRLRAEFSGIFVSGDNAGTSPRFPSVFIEEMDNASYRKSMVSSGEVHGVVMYDVNIYSDKETGRKAECKAIMAIVDEEFTTLGFERIMRRPLPNLDDKHIYRMVARYRAIVSKDKVIYRG